MSLFKYNPIYVNTKKIPWDVKVPGIAAYKDRIEKLVRKFHQAEVFR